MAQIRINWKLIIVLLIAFIALAATAFGLRQWNRTRRSTEGYAEGQKAFEEERWEEAASDLGKYLSLVQDDADILMKYAEAQLKRTPPKRSNLNQAINAYRRVLRLDDSYEIEDLRTEAATNLVDLYLQMNILGEAELIAEKQLKRGNDKDIRLKLAIIYIRQKKYEEAASELDSIIKDDPSHLDAYNVMGQLAEQRPQDFSIDAKYWYDKAVEKNPVSARAYTIRGSYYLRQKKNTDAIADFEQAQKQDLSDVKIKLSLAGGFIDAEEIEKAQSLLDSVYETEPDNLSLWKMRATIGLRSKSKEQMCQIARDGLTELSLNPKNFLPSAADLFIRGEDFDSAADCIEQMKQLDFEEWRISFLNGLLAQQQAQWSQVVTYMRQVIEVLDQNREPEVCHLMLSSALAKMGDRQSAIHQLRMLVAQYPGSFAARMNLSRLYLDAGDFALAAENAQAADMIDPGNNEAQMLYIRARMRLIASGQLQATQKVWNDLETNLAQLAKLDTGSSDPLSANIAMIQIQIHRASEMVDQQKKQQADTLLAQAQKMVDQLKTQYPDDIRPYSEEVDILLATDKIDQAITKLKEMTAAFPESVPTVTYLIGLLARQDKLAECEDIVNQAIQRTESDENIHDLKMLLADVYANTNKIDEANQLLESLLENKPNNIPLILRLIRYKYVKGQIDGIQQLIDKVKAIEGDQGWQWRYQQALLWVRMDEYKDFFTKAAALLKENIGSNPDDMTSSVLLAKWYEQMEELDLAISTYRQAIERAPDNVNILIPAIAVMYKAEKFEQADEIMARLPEAKLADPRITRFELQKHIREGELSSASNVLEKMIALNPDNSNDLIALAILKRQQNKPDEAKNIFNQVIGQDPNSIPAIRGLVEIELSAGNNDQAMKLCDQMVTRIGNMSAYWLRSKANIVLGKMEQSKEGKERYVDQAKKDMEMAVELEPEKIRKYILRSEYFRSIGEFEVAATITKEALTEIPDDLNLQKQRMLDLLSSNDPEQVKQGQELLDKALEMNPDDLGLRLQKVQILRGKSTAPAIAEALKILQDITSQKPTTEQAWIMLSDLHMSQGESGRALDITLNGLVHVPKSRGLLLLKARAEAQRSPALAIPSYKQLLERNPQDIEVVYYLSNTYSEAGLHDKAIELLNQHISTEMKPSRTG